MTIIIVSNPLLINANFCFVKYYPAPNWWFHRTEIYKHQTSSLSAQPDTRRVFSTDFISICGHWISPAILLSSLSVSWIHHKFHTVFCCIYYHWHSWSLLPFFSRSFTNMTNIISPDNEPCQSPMAAHRPWKNLFPAFCCLSTSYSIITLLGSG